MVPKPLWVAAVAYALALPALLVIEFCFAALFAFLEKRRSQQNSEDHTPGAGRGVRMTGHSLCDVLWSQDTEAETGR